MNKLTALALALFTLPVVAGGIDGDFGPGTEAFIGGFTDGPRTVAFALDLEKGVAEVTQIRGDGSVHQVTLDQVDPMGADYRFRTRGVGALILYDCKASLLESIQDECKWGEVKGMQLVDSGASDVGAIRYRLEEDSAGRRIFRDDTSEKVWDDLGDSGARIIIDVTDAGLTGGDETRELPLNIGYQDGDDLFLRYSQCWVFSG